MVGKICTKCPENGIQDLTNFTSNGKGGLRSACKICCYKQTNQYRQNNLQKCCDYSKKYRHLHVEQLLKYQREYRAINGCKTYQSKEETAKHSRNYYYRHKEKLQLLYKEQINNLDDNYIKNLMRHQGINIPEVIELKRNQIKMYRHVKNKK